jgi:UrcA family protein
MKALILAAALVATAAPALAQSDVDVPTAKVAYREADFANEASVHAFYARLKMAAQRVCAGRERSLASFQAARSCERNALDRAVAQIDRQELYALQSGRGVGLAVAGR